MKFVHLSPYTDKIVDEIDRREFLISDKQSELFETKRGMRFVKFSAGIPQVCKRVARNNKILYNSKGVIVKFVLMVYENDFFRLSAIGRKFHFKI